MRINLNQKEEPIEKQLWKAADKLRKNIDAAEYKHIVLGLIFLKYISDAFEELYRKLGKGEGEYACADPEDKDEYKAENVFFVPEKAVMPKPEALIFLVMFSNISLASLHWLKGRRAASSILREALLSYWWKC